jgi:hypothetical protein
VMREPLLGSPVSSMALTLNNMLINAALFRMSLLVFGMQQQYDGLQIGKIILAFVDQEQHLCVKASDRFMYCTLLLKNPLVQ